MFNVGDIVKPKKGYVGDRYLFKIFSKYYESDPECKWKYKLHRVEQELSSINGPYNEQLHEIVCVELTTWNQDELILVKSFSNKDDAVDDAVDALNYYATCVCGRANGKGISYQPYEPQPDKPQEITSKNLFDTGTTFYNYYKNLCEKENKNMKILNIYDARKRGQIEAEFKNKKDKILAEDEIQKIIKEMVKQVNTILENEAREDRYWVDDAELYQEATLDKLDDLEAEKKAKLDELRSTLDEIQALFEMTEDYQERMKILEKYGIIKNGKVNI